MRRLTKRWILAAVCCSGLCGCQGRTSTTTSTPANRPAPPVAAAPSSENPSNATDSPHPAEPEAPPVAAVRSVLRGVDAGRLEALADFLPESYRQDVESLIHAFVEKMPDELWNRLHTLAVKGATLLKKHPRFGEPADGAAADDADFRAKLASALDTFTDPKVWDRTQWQSFELRAFLSGPGTAIFAAWRNLSPSDSSVLKETKIRLVNIEGDQATLEFQSPLEPEPRPVEFVQVEGKWIPKPLADGWADFLQQGRAELEQLETARFAETADRLRPLLLQIERTLDQMLAAERPEQVQLGWWQVQSLLVQSRQELQGAGPPPRVEIRITGEISDMDLTELLDQLVQAADHPDAAEYVTFPTATGTVIQLSPVENFEAFAKRLTFVTVKGQDAENRSVDVERGRRN